VFCRPVPSALLKIEVGARTEAAIQRGRLMALPSDSQSFVIVGAGAIGTFVGLVLHDVGFKVRFLQRESSTAQAQRGVLEKVGLVGLCSTDPSYRTEISADRVGEMFTTDPTCLTACSYILVATKRGANAAVLKQLVDNGVKCPVFLLQNGLSASKGMQASTDFEVIETVVSFNVVYDGSKGTATLAQSKAEAKLLFDGSRTAGKQLAKLLMEVGRQPTSDSRGADRASDSSLAFLGRGSGLPFTAVAAAPLLGYQAGKLVLNMTNAVNAPSAADPGLSTKASGRPIKPMFMDAAYRVVLAACIKEVQDVFAAAGIRPVGTSRQENFQLRFLPYLLLSPSWLFSMVVGRKLKGREHAFTSMAQDLMARRVPTEIDFLNGEISKMAVEYNIEAPINRALIEAVKLAEMQNDGCPQYSGESLMALTGAQDSGVLARAVLNSIGLVSLAMTAQCLIRARL